MVDTKCFGPTKLRLIQFNSNCLASETRRKMAESNRARMAAMVAGLIFVLLWIARQNRDSLLLILHPKLRGSNLQDYKNISSIQRRELRVVVPKQRKLPPLVGYGGEPDASHFPLQLCEGDCDTDSDVSIRGCSFLNQIVLALTVGLFHFANSVIQDWCACKEKEERKFQAAPAKQTTMSRLISV